MTLKPQEWIELKIFFPPFFLSEHLFPSYQDNLCRETKSPNSDHFLVWQFQIFSEAKLFA